MKRSNFWKRTLAGILAMLTVAGYTPLANVGGGGLFDRSSAIVAYAEDTTATVSTYEQLRAAIANSSITNIIISSNIDVPCETVGTAQDDASSCQLIIDRSLTIESKHGQKYMIKRTQASGATNGSLKSLFGISGNGTGGGFNNVTSNTVEVAFRNLIIDGGANWGESGLTASSFTNTGLSGRSIIDVYKGATLNLEDGLVIRNGHITKPNNTFNLTLGNGIDASGNYGGGIRVEYRPEYGGGTVNVKAGAEINNCRAGGYGGALGAYNFAHLNVYGGTIHNCVATRGGAIGCTYRGTESPETAGTITMYGGLIYDCATVQGDGETLRGGALQLEGNTQNFILGGTIRNCSSTCGGAIGTGYGSVTIHVPEKTTNLLNISDCSVNPTDNAADYASIFLENSTLEVPQILTITFDARRSENDTYAELTVQKDASGCANLGEAFPGEPVRPGYMFGGWYDNQELTGDPINEATIFNDNATLYAKWRESIAPAYVTYTPASDSYTVKIGNTTLTADTDYTITPGEGHFVTVKGIGDYGGEIVGILKDDIFFNPWTATNSLPATAGNWYLADDVTISATWSVPTGTTKLNLNGHGIKRTGSGRVIDISSSGKTLNLYDSDTTTVHKFTVADAAACGAGLATVNDNLTGTAGTDYQTFTGGYITGGNGVNGAGIYVFNNATLNMYGGTVIGNTTASKGEGGGIRGYNGGKIRVYGGAIAYNKAYSGAGIQSPNTHDNGYDYASVSLSDCRVEYNYGTYEGAGVCTGQNVPLTIAGSTVITKNYLPTGNQAGVSSVWGTEPNSAKAKISGSPYIYDNFNINGQSNLGGAKNWNLQAVGSLSADTKVGLYNQATGVYNYYVYAPTDAETNEKIDPNVLFPCDNPDYGLIKNGNNAEKIKLLTVSYDANNATDGTVPTDSNRYFPNGTVTVLGNTGSLERAGYTFDGWNTLANGTGTTYSAGNTFDIAANRTLYAKWTALPATAPIISEQPGNLSLTYGYTSGNTLSVTAANATDTTYNALSYQWYSNTTNSNTGGTLIPNATSASYNIPTGKNAGTTEYYYCVITATRTDNSQTETATSNVAAVTVGKTGPTANAPTGLTATYGQTLSDVTLNNPAGNTEGTWAWVDSTASVGDVGVQTFKANFTPTDSTNYNSASNIDVSVNVGKADNPLTYAAKTVTKSFSTSAQTATLNAATDGQGDVSYAINSQKDSSNSDVSYFTLDGTTLTIGANTPAGTYTVIVRATAAGNGNYNSGTADSSVTVTIDTAANSLTGASLASNQSYRNRAIQLITNGGTPAFETIDDVHFTVTQTNEAPDQNAAWNTYKNIKANGIGTYYVWYETNSYDANNDGTNEFAGVGPTLLGTVKITRYVPPYSSQTWEMTMESYEYDGTAHTPKITGQMYGDVTYTYYNTDTNTELNGAPSAVGNYKVVVYAEGGSSHYGRTLNAEYSITAKPEPPAPTEYTVNVKNGTINSKTTGSYVSDTVLVAKANQAPAGYKFAYWKKNGVTSSYSESYTFPLSRDMELEAVYTLIADEFQTDGTGQLEGFNADKENGKISVSVLHSVPNDCKILKAGIVATSNTAKLGNLTAETADYVRYSDDIKVHNFEYTWTKTQVTANQTWYIRSYLEYQDANGNVKTVYGDMVQATLDGYKVQMENRIVGASNMEDIVCDKENQTLTFVALMSVPVDCSVKFAGIVATSDAAKKDYLTKITATEKTMVNDCYVRGMESKMHNVEYKWTKTAVTPDQTWYVRSYLVYVDANGKEQIVYGDLITQKLV